MNPGIRCLLFFALVTILAVVLCIAYLDADNNKLTVRKKILVCVSVGVLSAAIMFVAFTAITFIYQAIF